MGKDRERLEFQDHPREYAKYADITILFGFETFHDFFNQEHPNVSRMARITMDDQKAIGGH